MNQTAVALPREVLKAFETVPDLYLILSPELIILTASDAYLQATLTRREEITGKYLFEVLPDHPAMSQGHAMEDLRASLEQVRRTRQPHRMGLQPYGLPRPKAMDGSLRETCWSLINTPVPDEQGNIHYIIHKVQEVTGPVEQGPQVAALEKQVDLLSRQALASAAEDITARKNVGQQIREKNALLEAILNAPNLGMAVYEAVRNGQGRIIDFRFVLLNKRTIALWGGRDLTGRRLLEEFPGNAGLMEDYSRVVETGIMHEHEVRYQQEGYNNWFAISASKFGDGLVIKWEEITEKKNAEQELLRIKDLLAQQATDKYLTLFNHMAQGFCIIEMIFDAAGEPVDYRFLEVNPVFEKQTGLKDAVGKTMRQLVPAHEDHWFRIYGQVARTGEAIHFENKAAHLAGGVWYDVYAFRTSNPEDQQVAILFHDISQRKRSEEALRESEERFRLFVTASSDTLFKMNANWSQILHLQRKGFLGGTTGSGRKWIDQHIPRQDQEQVQAAIRQAIETRSVFELEHRVIKADGKTGWAYSRAIPVLDQQGEIREWFGATSDISLRKQAEQQLKDFNALLEQQVGERTAALRESKDHFQAAINVSPVVLSILKSIRNKKNKIVDFHFEWVSKSGEVLAGKDVTGLRLLEQFPYLREIGVFQRFVRTAEGEGATDFEYYYNAEGFDMWIRWKAVRLDDGLFVSVEDISEVKRLEEENLQMRLSQQKALLLAILEAQEEERRRISESLHNGVGQILYATKLNLDQVARLVPRQAIQTTENLLSEAINETRRVSHELVPFVLKDFGLEAAVADLCRQFSGSTLQLSCQTEGLQQRLEPYLEIALYRISQELVNNIVRHARATDALLLLSCSANRILLQVQDNGIGITREALKTKGIGLRTIRDRVKLLNGTFAITPLKSGKGTLVTIRIPVQE